MMNKYIKLALLALILVGVVIGIFLIPREEPIPDPDFTSYEANSWKEKIDELCQDDKWSPEGYEAIETGIHYDNQLSDGELISDEEERILENYLYSMSVSYLWKAADEHFKLTSYEDSKVRTFIEAKTLMDKKAKQFDKNGNQKDFSDIVSAYKYIIGSMSFNTKPDYSNPLPEFSKETPEKIKNNITGSRFYKSHFSKNSMIKKKLDSFISEWNKAEQEFYKNLELAIEKQYPEFNAALLDDQIRFIEISKNDDAVQRLEKYVRSLN